MTATRPTNNHYYHGKIRLPFFKKSSVVNLEKKTLFTLAECAST
jgi:hypothetical protein